MIGTTVGPYRIESIAGSGGMGVVYRATDTQLNRPVAIKVLPADATADPERRRRFVQEAKAASALNHPDIVTIYQIGTAGTSDFIAMEFVAGRSLEEVLRGRPLPHAETVRYGIRIADALAAAHRAGIVHRDLKPANVMVTEKTGIGKTGIKLLDFGVAKLTDRRDQSTMVGPATRTGMVVGTFAYMSPEQAQGGDVDARSDIFSFGVLLHEMLTGKRPSGEPIAQSLAAAPRDLRRTVARCLQPDRDQRFQAMDDVRMALEDAELGPDSGAAHASPSRGRRAVVVGLLAVSAAAVAGGGAAFGWWLTSPPPARTPILTRLTVDSGLTSDPALSPDGRFIAFASDRSGDGNLDIWVRQVAGGDPVRLTTDAADDVEPAFSPDGSRIAFRSERDGGGVYVTSTLGGEQRRIIDHGRRPRWSPDGAQILGWTGLATGFLISASDAPRTFVVPAAGGEPVRLFPDFAVAASPIWSPDGSHVVFLGMRELTGRPDWWSAALGGSAPVTTGAVAGFLRAALAPPADGLFVPDGWTRDGRILFSARQGDATNIWAIPVDAGGRIATGRRLSWNGRLPEYARVTVAPERLTSGTTLDLGVSAAADGTLAFAAVTNLIDLWSLPIDPAGKPTGPMQRLTQDPATDVYPWLSPDGRSLVYASNRSGVYDALVRDLPTGRDSVVAQRFGFPSPVSFTKDGLRIIYQSGSVRHRWLSVPLAGAGAGSSAPQVVCDDCESFWDASADGKLAIFGSDGDTSIHARNTATGVTNEILRSPKDQIMGRLRISPDGRWMVFNHRESGSIRVYLVPFTPGAPLQRERWIPLTDATSISNAPVWSPDGATVYYISNADGRGVCVLAQRIDRATGRPDGAAFGAWHFHEARLSISRIPLGSRSMAASRDRLVVAVSEGAGNIWIAR